MRISSDRNMPVSTAASARKKYCKPMTLWSRLKIHFRMKPCGAACAWASWLTMLLLLRLPCRQPLTELFIADDLHNSVHLVMTEPAKLCAGKFKFPGLNRGKVHVNGQAGHGVLLEPHRRHK